MITLESTTPEEVRQMPADSVDLRVLCALAVGFHVDAISDHLFLVDWYKGMGITHVLLREEVVIHPHDAPFQVSAFPNALPDFANDPAAANLVLEYIESHHKCAWQTGKNGMVGNSYDCVSAPVIDDDCHDCTWATGETWMHAVAKVGVLLALERGK